MKELFDKADLRLMTAEECAGHTIDYAAGWKACIDWIMSVPAQPERKTGRWIPVDCYSACGGDEVTWMAHGNPTAFYYCSECKEQCYAGEDGESLLTSFCPHCGAKMKGGDRMSDLIDRQVAIDALRNAENHAFNSFYQGLLKAHRIIADLPAAEPEERKKGKWIEFNTTSHSYVCSVCRRSLVNITSGKKTVVRDYPFCHCGAEMTGVEDYQKDESVLDKL